MVYVDKLGRILPEIKFQIDARFCKIRFSMKTIGENDDLGAGLNTELDWGLLVYRIWDYLMLSSSYRKGTGEKGCCPVFVDSIPKFARTYR